MQTAVGNLLDRAERVSAAISVFDDQNRVVAWNQSLSNLYEFIDFTQPQTYEGMLWQCISKRLLNETIGNKCPSDWVRNAVHFHKSHEFAQFVRRLPNGRILLITHEKISGSGNWWYQARVDITQDVLDRIRSGQSMFGALNWDRHFEVPSQAPVAKVGDVLGIQVGDALEAMPTAAAVIKERGRVLDANRAFLALLRRGTGLIEIDGRVVARNASEQAVLSGHIASFVQERRVRAPAMMRISCPDSVDAYYISISPLFSSGRPLWDENSQMAVMTVMDSRSEPTIELNALAEFLQLSLAEAQVAADIGAGKTAQEIARQRGSSPHTVYSQIKSILAKTGFRGQADIARCVVGLSWVFGQKNGP